MAVVNKDSIQRPTQPKETVAVPELNGEVVVRGLLLRDRLELSIMDVPKFGQISVILSRCVVDENGDPIFSADEWEAWGSLHQDAAFNLFEVAKRLSNIGGEEKKEPAPS